MDTRIKNVSEINILDYLVAAVPSSMLSRTPCAITNVLYL